MQANINEDAVNAAVNLLLGDALIKAKALVARADKAKTFLMETITARRGTEWRKLKAGDAVELNGVIRFEAVEKDRFNQVAFGLEHPEMLANFTRRQVEIHTKKI